MTNSHEEDGTQHLVVLVSCPEEEASEIARVLVSERLAACVNILPKMNSVYRWQGAVEESVESGLMIKTSRARFAELRDRVVELHSYSCPEVIALEIADGFAPYLDWITESIKQSIKQSAKQENDSD